MILSDRRALGLALVWAAGVAGVLHAGFSAYWALGGRWLLATVGEWAVELADEAPVRAGVGLGAVAAVKLLGALVPIAVAYGLVAGARFWRGVSWVGGLLLVAYSGLNTVVALAVLAGLIRPKGGYDAEAMRGHAFLWDPLFLFWGAALVLSLWFSRSPARSG